MGDTSTLRRICACLADGDFVSPMRCVDEGYLGAGKELVEQLGAVGAGQVTLDEFDIGKF